MLVMEYVPICLRQYVEETIPPDRVKTRILSHIAQGLQYLHSLDPPIIHRDLTTSNVLLTTDLDIDNLQAKIADLGVSKLLDRSAIEAMTKVPGNVAHMPPEALMVDGQYYSTSSFKKAKKLDIFSYGNVIINILTGKFPSTTLIKADHDAMDRRRTEVQRRDHLLAIIPESKLKDLIIRCLNNNPDHRPTIDQVVNRLKDLPEEEGEITINIGLGIPKTK